MNSTKILIGILVGVIILGTTLMLYQAGDEVYLDRFIVYSEAYIGAVIAWLGLSSRKKAEKVSENIQMEEMRTD